MTPLKTAERLWQLLDHIDTLGDSMKPERTPYFEAVNTLATKRHQYLTPDPKGEGLVWPPQPHGRIEIECMIVGHEETREIRQKRDVEGTLTGLEPVPDSRQHWLNLTLPNGSSLRVQVEAKDFDAMVLPILTQQLAATAEPALPVP